MARFESPTQMILYHTTSGEKADAIKRDGFRDGVGSYMTDTEHCGVWLSDRPLDANEGAWGDTTIAIDLPLSEADLDQQTLCVAEAMSGPLPRADIRSLALPLHDRNGADRIRR